MDNKKPGILPAYGRFADQGAFCDSIFGHYEPLSRAKEIRTYPEGKAHDGQGDSHLRMQIPKWVSRIECANQEDDFEDKQKHRTKI